MAAPATGSTGSGVVAKVFVILGSIAALLTIGSAGHCWGLQTAQGRIAKLELDNEKLIEQVERLRRTSDIEGEANSGDALDTCSKELARCEQDQQSLRIRLASANSNRSSNADSDRGSSEAASGSSSRVASFVPVQESSGLRVQLDQCVPQADVLKCDFSTTSLRDDHTEYLRRSRLVERDGNEIPASTQQFGNSESNGRQVYARLVRGVPIRGSVTFAGVDFSLTEDGISLLELQFDSLRAQFRDVPIEN